jgi:hypothetical protein
MYRKFYSSPVNEFCPLTEDVCAFPSGDSDSKMAVRALMLEDKSDTCIQKVHKCRNVDSLMIFTDAQTFFLFMYADADIAHTHTHTVFSIHLCHDVPTVSVPRGDTAVLGRLLRYV